MSEQVQRKFLLWSYNEILRSVWATDKDCDQRMANVLARANVGSIVLTGTDKDREELSNSLLPDVREEILNLEVPA